MNKHNFVDMDKEVQYVIVNKDSSSDPSTVTLDLTYGSNVQPDNINQVIGLRIVDFYITNISSNSDGEQSTDIKYIDLICRDIPKRAQILEPKSGGQIFCRVPLERGFEGSNSLKLHDKQWRRGWDKPVLYFNPISIKKLNFELKQFTGDNTYGDLADTNCQYYFTLEITTLSNRNMY